LRLDQQSRGGQRKKRYGVESMKFTFAPESKPLDGYTIKRAIYRGGFGEVYYALSDAGREVALKLLQNNTEIELRGVQQCLNLGHPNLVTIFDIKQDKDGDHWIVMEYAGGETLDNAIRRYPQGMPMEEIRRWLPGMVAGVAFLHEHGLVHRDLKPANIFSDSGSVKIGDVGLSKFITPSRRSAQTQSVGTVYYMAPEVAKGRYGKEVDVYALGVILFEMLTGRVPFDGDSTGEILMKHLTERPDLGRLPPRLRPVIGTALEKDPAKRFSNVAALARAFEDAVLGRGQASNGTSEPHPVNSPYSPAMDRRPMAAVAAAMKTARSAMPDRKALSWSGRRWRHVNNPSSAGEFGSTTVKWALLAMFFAWIGWTALVPVAIVLAAIFGVMFTVKMVTSTAGGVASFLTGAVRDARFAASKVGLAAKYTAGAVAGAPRAAGHAVRAGVHRCVMGVPTPGDLASLTPAVTRWTHWTGAAAASTLVVAAFTVVLGALWPRFSPSHGQLVLISPVQLVTFATTALMACWAITGVTKFWDGTRGGLMPRLSLGIVGAAVGAGVFLIQSFLLAGLPDVSPLFQFHSDIATHSNEFKISPPLMGSMVCFAALFAVRNWTRQTSISRTSRLRLTSMAFTSLVAAVVAGIMETNVELMMTWAAVVSATVQIASAWQPQSEPVRQAA
jgi:eukaryotic-like serine/threonine-protein kinase